MTEPSLKRTVMTVPAATYTQDAATGIYTVDPGVSNLVITGML